MRFQAPRVRFHKLIEAYQAYILGVTRAIGIKVYYLLLNCGSPEVIHVAQCNSVTRRGQRSCLFRFIKPQIGIRVGVKESLRERGGKAEDKA